MNLDGVLFFPVTPFDASGAVDPDLLATHVKSGLAHGPGAVFAACGTGEFHALDLDEYETVVAAAVGAVGGAVPVFGGAGGAFSHAIACARRAAAAGADGLLVLPPYLVTGPEAGTVAYVEAVAAATDLPLVLYQRGGMRFSPQAVVRLARLPTVVGLKDGLGDLDLMQRIVLAVRTEIGEDFMFFNGLPTAEQTQAAYQAIGVPLYSSAVFCFAPELSVAFHHAVTSGDEQRRTHLLGAFFRPLVELRDSVPGYAVSLVKAGVRLRGLDVGGVRPPLVDPSAAHLQRIRELIEVADGLV
ncbi:5-dehydro-4-deoxyglucarate dehydratase [Jiangella anatolica]|uniref:Probable 5-dehydro-4-deoxyglucarate dehydratase n=1 Tax=Jiangella anatolica TaxID=2670374 RepID=A0A2W2BCC0_9ACTN|nr:5-dehydro-4-deoxyglucarate dehydratase [Jiangella anatolica]PZF85291.1 5-dehydro-4-deoxyglucarate dehydratase [Jiangella anatolica]